ncbi:MAG: HAD-IA family hydrolase [Flavobacteriaceae bacterium]|nr:HAD-IA family hydrolase [Flavobacteriaceae bacterium]
MIKYLLFDVANTLLHKPLLWDRMEQVLFNHGHVIPQTELRHRHKLVSECYTFPDRTSEGFYKEFNATFLRAFGMVPDDALLDALFIACKNLPWEPFDDVGFLRDYEGEIGVLSNFNRGLKPLLKDTLPELNFSHIIVSEEEGVAKPNALFFQKAISEIGYDPSEILYIGDSVKLDIEPALDLGMQARLIDRDACYPDSKLKISSLMDILNTV